MSRSEQRTYAIEVQEIRRMSSWWREWAAALGLSGEIQDRGELCLNELAGNVIQHGTRASAIVMTLDDAEGAIRMTIADDGDPFDPMMYPTPEFPRALADARPGGLGVHILRTSADMSYHRADGWNAVTLTLVQPGK